MSHPATEHFFDGLQSSRLLDDARVGELKARPEAAWGDVAGLANYAQERGWLTPYQSRELQAGRGGQLSVAGYQIFDKIDESPAGTTYKALHPALQQPVALRVLRSEWLAPADSPGDYVARAQSAGRVQSPHLAMVLDAGILDGSSYVAQEFVDGCDLFRLVNEMGALPVGLACEYVRQAALALKAAHAWGIVHGEVSPHALLLTPVKRATGSNGDVSVRPRPGASVKLAELGLAPRRPPIGEMTYGQSDRLGPVAFLAPERLTSGERTEAGDLYGLGATLYFLLTTRAPHGGDSPLATLLELQQAEPVPLATLKSDVPGPVTELAHRLLSRDPEARPSAGEVVEALYPHCEPSAMPPEPSAPPVLMADATDTQPSIPTAVPVARDLERTEEAESTQPFAEPIADQSAASQPMPEIQPLDSRFTDSALVPEVHPLDEHHDDHLTAFGHSAMGADKPRTPRQRASASSKQKFMIAVGLVLHLTATVMCLGWLGVIPNPFASKSTQEAPHVEEKKDTTPKKSKKRNP
jgi:serine/threonine-protein kinase